MHIQSRLWLDCDISSFAVLIVGISAVSMLALGAF